MEWDVLYKFIFPQLAVIAAYAGPCTVGYDQMWNFQYQIIVEHLLQYCVAELYLR